MIAQNKVYKIIKRILTEPTTVPLAVYANLSSLNVTCWVPSQIQLKIWYFLALGKTLNLKEPTGFNEKLQWLKLYNRNPAYTKLVDKYEVREFVKKEIGEEYLIPIVGVYNRFDEINFEQLPSQFVLKCTHDSGSTVICKDKNNFDYLSSKAFLEKKLKDNMFWTTREWVYKNIKPRIVCEDLIQTEDNKPPRDYKIFCFHGEPKFCFVASDRDEATKFDFFDIDWNRQPLKQGYPNSDYEIKKPEQWDVMLGLAIKLAKDIPHVRIDFYIDGNGRVLFGEMTFFHFSGMVRFEPESYDQLLGSWLDLSKVTVRK